MTGLEKMQLAVLRRQASALERIATALEKQGKPLTVLAEDGQVVTWQDAVRVIMDTCKNAEECSEGGCPMASWCEGVLPTDCAPADWLAPEGG